MTNLLYLVFYSPCRRYQHIAADVEDAKFHVSPMPKGALTVKLRANVRDKESEAEGAKHACMHVWVDHVKKRVKMRAKKVHNVDHARTVLNVGHVRVHNVDHVSTTLNVGRVSTTLSVGHVKVINVGHVNTVLNAVPLVRYHAKTAKGYLARLAKRPAN